jgi:hypothetical protein
MRTGIGAVVLVGTVVLATGPGAAASATARTWTVRPGGAITAMAGKTTLKDTPTGAMIACESSRMSGPLKQGSGLAGAGIGTITTAAVGRCDGPGFAPRLTPGGLPWQLNLTSYDRATGVARGTISHLELSVVVPEVGCTAVINGTGGTAPDGAVPVSYTGKTGTLKILQSGGDLHWYHVARHCAGIVNSGDAATLAASYTISPRQAITSP